MNTEVKTILTDQYKEEPTLPGANILFASAGSSGSHTNLYGNGGMDISLHRPGQKPEWTHVAEIYFSSPTLNQYEDMQTSPAYSEGEKEFGNHRRRMSKKQAEFICSKISHFLMDEFKGMIPSDAEIDEIMMAKK